MILEKFYTITKSISIPINDSFVIRGYMANIKLLLHFRD